MLSCTSVWLRCQKEAEKWISDCDGQLMTDHPELINARINAAYAWLASVEPRFEWAALAAFASKQVGCGLLHFNAHIGQANVAPKVAGGLVLPTAALNGITAEGAQYMKEQIAIGNRNLFLDIYPLHRFYMLRGIEGIRSCLAQRQRIRDKVDWEVGVKLPFGLPFKEILAGFEAVERGDIEESVVQLATHEQINVLQPILYSNPKVRALLDVNQAMWVTGFPSGHYHEVQLTLSAQCKPKQYFTTPFNRSLAVALWNPDDRMKFVLQAARKFGKLWRGKAKADVERSLQKIYAGSGIK